MNYHKLCYWRPCGYCGKPVFSTVSRKEIVKCSRVKCRFTAKKVDLMTESEFYSEASRLQRGERYE